MFVGHCMADDLVDQFFEFVRDLALEFNLWLALEIDGHNVNKSFKSKLAAELQKRKSHTSWFLVHVLFALQTTLFRGYQMFER